MEIPATLYFSDEDITRLIRNGSQFEIRKIICHSQLKERHVKQLIEASFTTCVAEVSDRFIHSLGRISVTKMNFIRRDVEPEVNEWFA